MNIYECIIIGICAYVYSEILTDGGMLLNKVFLFAKDKLPHWLANPLICCVYCVSGQMALWYYLFTHLQDYNFIHHIVYICLTIFTVEIIVTTKANLK